MNIRTCFLLYLLISSQYSFSQEHKHHHHPKPTHHRSAALELTPNDIHLHIEVPDRPDNPEPHTPQDIKRLKVKVAATTAIITALIGAGVSLYIGLHNCN